MRHFLILFISTLPSFALDMREWTSSDGERKIQAELVGIKGSMITIKRVDGGIIDVSPDLFSQEDQIYIFENLDTLYAASDFRISKAQIQFNWIVDASFKSELSFQYFGHEDQAAITNKKGDWVFYANRHDTIIHSHMPPISIRIRSHGDPFGVSPNNPLASTTGTSKPTSNSIPHYLIEKVDRLESQVVEKELAVIDGMLCRYYKIDDLHTTNEIWSIPMPESPYKFLFSQVFKDICYYPEFTYSEMHRKREGRALKDGTLRTEKVFYYSLLDEYLAIRDECPIQIKTTAKGNANPQKFHSLETFMKASSISSASHGSGQSTIDSILRKIEPPVVDSFTPNE